ncbi:CHAP domain-containing protein [Bifidobacterium sp. SO1]|uniref:CHAP domain-containing protein n=1 Tax=Bifidobacterium sp. SO1 TaxID=2809029 RepID=UPI001F0B5088|nr:CHAP domain-containing protein [Bifidobacterium sp. SO1]
MSLFLPSTQQASATPFDSSTAITRSALTASSDSQAASRDAQREPLVQSDSNDGSWGSSDEVDTSKLTLLKASNPVVKSLINGRDLGQTPAKFNPDHTTGDSGNSYPYGQCTWWAYKRRAELGLPTGSRFGNAQNWPASARSLGYWVDSTPRVGDAVVFKAGQYGADATYGHVGVVEKVHADGSITISEANVNGQVGPFSRDLDKDQASQLEYVHY